MGGDGGAGGGFSAAGTIGVGGVGGQGGFGIPSGFPGTPGSFGSPSQIGNPGAGGAGGAAGNGGNGGRATATANAAGAADVAVTANATGGAGIGAGGSGAATANATGLSAGGGAVTAQANANANAGGSFSSDAVASASATSQGGGLATATASSSGASGRATTQSLANGGAGAVTNAQANANAPNPVSAGIQSRTVASIAGSPAARPAATTYQAFSQVTALPRAADVSTAVAGRPNVAAFSSQLSTDALALVNFGGGRPTLAFPGTVDFTGSVALTIDPAQLAHGSGALTLGLIDSQSSGNGFSSFRFTLNSTASGAPLLDQTFTTLADAQAYFNDRVLGLGALGNATQTLTFGFTLTSNINGPATDAFNVRFLVANAGAVPEPGAWLPLLAGLAVWLARPAWRCAVANDE